MSDCIFCRIAAHDLPAETVFESDEILAFKDISPAAPVHLLIIPKKHIATLNDLEAGDSALLVRMMEKAVDLAKEQGIAESGYRLVVNCNKEGGQEVFHVHLHLLGGRPLGGMVSR